MNSMYDGVLALKKTTNITKQRAGLVDLMSSNILPSSCNCVFPRNMLVEIFRRGYRSCKKNWFPPTLGAMAGRKQNIYVDGANHGSKISP